MKTFIADIIPKIQKFSQKLDNITLLTNQHWVVVDEIANSKTVYIFRSNNELIISRSGIVERAKWEYLDKQTILIDTKAQAYLFRHGFFDENILALKIDGKEEYAFLVNETKFDKELNSADRILEFLQRKYIEPYQRQQVESEIGVEIENPKVIAKPIIVKTAEELAKEQRVYEDTRKTGNRIKKIILIILIIIAAVVAVIAIITGILYSAE
jgi:hypothetical protein